MNKPLRQIALSLTTAAALVSFSIPSHAFVYAAGDALLIPLVVWSNGDEKSDSEADDVNTIIEVTVPSSIGHEDLANVYTARVSTPTNADLGLKPADPDLDDYVSRACDEYSQIKWFWFDKNSKKQKNGTDCVSADDVVQINWRQVSGEADVTEDRPGYMVISTYAGTLREDANFAMFGEAYLVSGIPGFVAHIPVLPLRDKADATSIPVSADNVIYTAAGVPAAVSPLVSGYRSTLDDDGNGGDVWSFDLMLSDRRFPTLHVIWFDRMGQNPESVDVFDTQENSCSDNIPLGYEVNTVLIAPTREMCGDTVCVRGTAPSPFPPLPASTNWATYVKYDLCEDNLDLRARGENVGGYLQYYVPEPADTGTLVAKSAAAAFAIKYAEIPDGPRYEDWKEPFVWAETAIGHNRGMFK